MKIRELVRVNREADFPTAIDLTSFREPDQNRSLVETFCFAKLPEGGNVKGSYDWISLISRGLREQNKNVWSLTANYGHGKTHFGVVLANFFGQPWGSYELQTIQRLLGQVSSPDLAEQLLAWRESRRQPYLTICLQGHQMPSLRQAVFQEVERELARHEQTRTYKAPLWQEMALRWLDHLDENRRAAAKVWADQHGRDLEDVRRHLHERDASHEFRDLVDDLNRHVMGGFPTDFGAEITVRDLLDKLHTDLCGPDKTFSGIAVIFDEFHRFVEKMAKGREVESLQDLLEAILRPDRVRNGSAFFIALGTMDPNDVAKQKMGDLDSNNPVIKELNRIPSSGCRYFLRSELEAVLDGLLSQQPGPWEEFGEQMKEPLRDATFITFAAFKKRFIDELQWNPGEVQEKVTKGAFPLHPITTQLLSNLKFEVVQNPRGVLDFVKDQYHRCADDEAERDGHPNWIFANELFEPFRQMLRSDVQTRIEKAFTDLGGDGTREDECTLTAMALITAGGLPTPVADTGGYARLVAEMAGLTLDAAKASLENLEARGIVEFDNLTKGYRLPMGASKAQFKGALRKVVPKVRLDTYRADSLTKLIRAADPDFTKARPITVKWGHPDDWAYERVVATRSQLEGESYPTFTFKDNFSAAGTRGWTRGVEIAYLPFSSEDIEWIKSEGPDLIRKMCPNLQNPPIIILSPEAPVPDVETALIDTLAVETMDASERAELKDQYWDGRNKIQQALCGVLKKVRQQPSFRIVAPGLKSTLESVSGQSDHNVGLAILEKAYSGAPLEFFNSAGLSSAKLVNDCARVAAQLLTNKLHTWYSVEGNGPAKTVAEMYLRDRWAMVGPDMVLRMPADARIRGVWDYLDDAFPPDVMKDLLPVLRTLAVPPFGLDTCTMALIVCGWLGSQGKALLLTLEGKQVSLGGVAGSNMVGLLSNLLKLRIKRENMPERNLRAQKLIGQIEGGIKMSRSEAEDALSALSSYCEDPEPEWSAKADQAFAVLKRDREVAKEYAELVNAATQAVDPIKTMDKIDQVGGIKLGVVCEPDWPSRVELRDQLVNRLAAYWSENGDRHAKINDVGYYGQQRTGLSNLAERAKKSNAMIVAEKIQEAITKLDQRKKQLLYENEQKVFIRALKDFQTGRQTLVELRRAKELFEAEASGLGDLSQEAAARFDKKISEISSEIENLENADRGVSKRLHEATMRRTVDSIFNELSRTAERLKDAPELLKVEEALNGIKAVQRMFDSLDRVDSNPPEKLSALQKEISIAETWGDKEALPIGLREYAKKVANKLKAHGTKLTNAADKEFEKTEKSLDNPKLSIEALEEAKAYFGKPSEFLSEQVRARSAGNLERVECKLADRSAEHIRFIACKLKGDKRLLLDLAKFMQQLAEES